MVLKREERRAQVLACALEVFAQKGYHAASISDIIEMANVARGTFYLYFESKRAVFDELLDDLFALLNSKVIRIDTSDGPAGVVGQMRSNVEAVITCLLENRAMLRLLLSEAVGLDPGFDHKLSEFYRLLAEMIQHSLELGLSMKLIRPVNTGVVSLCILGSIKEVLYQAAMGGQVPSKDILVDEILKYNVRGLFVPEVADSLGNAFGRGNP